LVKNYLQKTKHSKTIVSVGVIFFSLLLIIFVLFFHTGAMYKRLIIAFGGILICLLPLFAKKGVPVVQKYLHTFVSSCKTVVSTRTVFTSGAILFLLSGLVIPSSLLASSVAEFSFLERYTSPLPFIAQTMQQGFGFFIFWVFAIYIMGTKTLKQVMAVVLSLSSCLVLINTYG
jgi:hypothetical protein